MSVSTWHEPVHRNTLCRAPASRIALCLAPIHRPRHRLLSVPEFRHGRWRRSWIWALPPCASTVSPRVSTTTAPHRDPLLAGLFERQVMRASSHSLKLTAAPRYKIASTTAPAHAENSKSVALADHRVFIWLFGQPGRFGQTRLAARPH